MIGGLLRFAPGRLGARQDRAPSSCVFRWWVVSSLPCGAPGDELVTRARAVTGRAVLSEPGWQPAAHTRARCIMGRLVWPAGITDDGGRRGRAARLRVWPRPSPSRSYARCAAPSASLTASLWHGIGSRDRQAREPASADAAQPSTARVETGRLRARIRATHAPKSLLGDLGSGGDRPRGTTYDVQVDRGFLLSSRSLVRVLPGAPAETRDFKIAKRPDVAISVAISLVITAA
jgi:hypothetical protein